MECNVPEKYVKMIQDLVQRLRNQGARVSGGESDRVNVDVGLHPRSALSPYLFLILMDGLICGEDITTRIQDVCG